jgi:hypothetical protein
MVGHRPSGASEVVTLALCLPCPAPTSSSSGAGEVHTVSPCSLPGAAVIAIEISRSEMK